MNNADVVPLEGEYQPLEYELQLIILKERFYTCLIVIVVDILLYVFGNCLSPEVQKYLIYSGLDLPLNVCTCIRQEKIPHLF